MAQLEPGDYALADRALHELRVALGTMAWSYPTGEVTALEAMGPLLKQIEALVRSHEREAMLEVMTRPVVVDLAGVVGGAMESSDELLERVSALAAMGVPGAEVAFPRIAAALRDQAHSLTEEADTAARDPDRQHEIHGLLDEAERAGRQADALEGGET